VVQNETMEEVFWWWKTEPGIAKVCMRTLTAEGFQVDIAENGGDCPRDVEGEKLRPLY